jgi:hypothetical protein
MQIPERYRDVYLKAKELDAQLEKEASRGNEEFFRPRGRVVVRLIDWIIRLEREIFDLNNKISKKQKEIEEAKLRLKEFGIEI